MPPAGGLLARRPAGAAAGAAALMALNRDFYALLWRRRGPAEAALGIALHALHHLTGVAAVPLGLAAALSGRRSPRYETNRRFGSGRATATGAPPACCAPVRSAIPT